MSTPPQRRPHSNRSVPLWGSKPATVHRLEGMRASPCGETATTTSPLQLPASGQDPPSASHCQPVPGKCLEHIHQPVPLNPLISARYGLTWGFPHIHLGGAQPDNQGEASKRCQPSPLTAAPPKKAGQGSAMIMEAQGQGCRSCSPSSIPSTTSISLTCHRPPPYGPEQRHIAWPEH